MTRKIFAYWKQDRYEYSQNILWFEVAVHDSTRMHVADCFKNLFEARCRISFRICSLCVTSNKVRPNFHNGIVCLEQAVASLFRICSLCVTSSEIRRIFLKAIFCCHREFEEKEARRNRSVTEDREGCACSPSLRFVRTSLLQVRAPSPRKGCTKNPSASFLTFLTTTKDDDSATHVVGVSNQSTSLMMPGWLTSLRAWIWDLSSRVLSSRMTLTAKLCPSSFRTLPESGSRDANAGLCAEDTRVHFKSGQKTRFVKRA